MKIFLLLTLMLTFFTPISADALDKNFQLAKANNSEYSLINFTSDQTHVLQVTCHSCQIDLEDCLDSTGGKLSFCLPVFQSCLVNCEGGIFPL